MPISPIVVGVVLFLGINASAQSVRGGELPKFMGREVTITEPEEDRGGVFRAPASVCLEGPPQRQCYAAPKEFGRFATVSEVQVEKDRLAILFSAATGGVSGWTIHFALLRPGAGKDLDDLFLQNVSLSNQSQHAFWNDAGISDAPFFVTADYVWGPDESHYSEHRFIISTYVRKRVSFPETSDYYLEDRYMTVHKYDLQGNRDVLAAEKQEILSRLRRMKAGAEPQRHGPRR